MSVTGRRRVGVFVCTEPDKIAASIPTNLLLYILSYYITVHYISLQFILLQYITLHRIDTTLHLVASHSNTLCYRILIT